MRLKRKLIRVADRPGGRGALATLATRQARRGTDLDVEVLHDRAWIHRIESTYIPVSDRFETRRDWDSAIATIFEPIEDYWFFLYRPGPGDTVIDVGAGDGLDALTFARAVGATGRVLAVEAHPDTFVLLEQTCRLNELDNVIPVQAAVMDHPGSVTIAEEGSRDTFSVVSRGNGGVVTRSVPGDTLDALCEQNGIEAVDFLKMNIEGAERYALAGAEQTLARTRHVCIACHDFLADRDADLATKAFAVEFLAERGFEVVRRDDHALPWVRDHVHGVRPSS
jgi:FkbM family methyltransferase